jgi:tRNA G18 (ribose-2'-O)-methylase SpoU
MRMCDRLDTFETIALTEDAPINFALVHLNKPHDIAMVAQTALSTEQLRVHQVGDTLGFDHPKVQSKVESWNTGDQSAYLSSISECCQTLAELKSKTTGRLIGTVVKNGKNPFEYNWLKDDVIVLGGANGLSATDVDQLDDTVTIPMSGRTSFLTVDTVVSVLTYHILNERRHFNSHGKQ